MKWFIYTLTALIVSAFTFTAYAQDSTDSAQTTPPTQAPRTQTYLERLTQDYFFQLEKYREVKEKYDFEKAEYKKLGTLASQEDAVTSQKQVMIARAGTIAAYLAVLDEQINQVEGVTLSEKQLAQDQISSSILFLNTHQEIVPTLFDKQNVNDASEQFEANLDQVYKAQYHALSLLSVARVRLALDQLTVATNDYQEDILSQSEESSTVASQQRGLKEVGQLIQDSDQIMENVELMLTNFQVFEKRSDSPKGKYESMIKQMEPVYANMQRAIEFLIELERNL